MTEEELIKLVGDQDKIIKRLEKQVRRLKKRMVEKKHYELGLLQFTGASPAYIAEINRKDELAMRD